MFWDVLHWGYKSVTLSREAGARPPPREQNSKRSRGGWLCRGNQSRKSARPESFMKAEVFRSQLCRQKRAACCLYEETESGRGSKSLPELPHSSLRKGLVTVGTSRRKRGTLWMLQYRCLALWWSTRSRSQTTECVFSVVLTWFKGSFWFITTWAVPS